MFPQSWIVHLLVLHWWKQSGLPANHGHTPWAWLGAWCWHILLSVKMGWLLLQKQTSKSQGLKKKKKGHFSCPHYSIYPHSGTNADSISTLLNIVRWIPCQKERVLIGQIAYLPSYHRDGLITFCHCKPESHTFQAPTQQSLCSWMLAPLSRAIYFPLWWCYHF